VVVVPATTNLLAMKFSCSVLIHPDGSNGLTADSVLLIGQVGPVDATRVVQVLGRLGDNDLALLEENLRLLLGL
jgi:mRNA-degrading endonuclease toxin of MazEF toxin-antitoxin module